MKTEITIYIETDNNKKYKLELDYDIYPGEEATFHSPGCGDEHELDEARLYPPNSKKYRELDWKFADALIEEYDLQDEIDRQIEKALQDYQWELKSNRRAANESLY